MYLHLGNDVVVDKKCIVGIFDMDNTTVSYQTRNFLAKAQKEGMVIDVADDLPKSFILTSEYGFTRIYESTLYTSTLEKRMK